MTKHRPSTLFLEQHPFSESHKRQHANDLSGREWTRYSISVWNDIRKTVEEQKFGHPAMFPVALVQRLLQCFTRTGENVVLDPFCGSGATLLGARNLGKLGIGFEVSKEYYNLALERLQVRQRTMLAGVNEVPEPKLYPCDARLMSRYIKPRSVDICITSPPYWDILSRKRTADYKAIRDYAPAEGDLSRLRDYEEFLDALAQVFRQVYQSLRSKKYCVVVVMDIRKQSKFYAFHADVATRFTAPDVGFVFDDLIIWDRSHEYNNLRPLGYPTTFRINKIHEYLLIFRKPE